MYGDSVLVQRGIPLKVPHVECVPSGQFWWGGFSEELYQSVQPESSASLLC